MTQDMVAPPSDGHPNSNPAAEAATLDALMSNPEIADTVGLRAGHYFVPRNALVHTAIMALYAEGEPTDPIAVTARLAAAGHSNRVNANYVIGLYSSPLSGAGGEWHARKVIELATLRLVDETGQRMSQAARVPGSQPADVVGQAQEWLTGLADQSLRGGPVRWSKVMDDTFESMEADQARPSSERGISTGLIDLDKYLTGFKPGQLIIVAARPGVGKSVMAVNLARAASFRQGVPTCFHSLEMHRVEVAKRFVAAEYSFPLDKLTSVELTDDDWAILARSAAKHTDAPLWIDDTPHQTLSSIRSTARRLKRTDDLGLVIVDYLQLIEATGGRHENRQQEVSNLSRGLKLLARELEIPVVFLAQLNRESEKRADKRPLLSDLRESGSLEQDADVVILINRPDDETARFGEVDLDVAKNRGGPTGMHTIAAQLHLSRFVDMAVGV